MNQDNFFAAIPYDVFDAYEKGDISPVQFTVMVWLHRWSDWGTGRVRKVSAARLTWATAEGWSERTFQRALHDLHAMGWIVSGCKAGFFLYFFYPPTPLPHLSVVFTI
jgi:hypothetical protein